MSDKELKQALQEIKGVCQEHTTCDGCKFYTCYGCVLKQRPDQWKISDIGIDKWYKLYSWLVDLRFANVPEAREGLKEYTIKKSNCDLMDYILEHMNQLDEEGHDET